MASRFNQPAAASSDQMFSDNDVGQAQKQKCQIKLPFSFIKLLFSFFLGVQPQLNHDLRPFTGLAFLFQGLLKATQGLGLEIARFSSVKFRYSEGGTNVSPKYFSAAESPAENSELLLFLLSE